jgi:hypothetical protein
MQKKARFSMLTVISKDVSTDVDGTRRCLVNEITIAALRQVSVF